MVNLAIKGHKIRGNEVIKILKMLGGKDVGYNGVGSSYYYYINDYDNIIGVTGLPNSKRFAVYSLEEFLEKFPYKVGDKAFAFGNKCTIIDTVWDEGIDEVVYTIKLDTSKYTTTKLNNQLQPYKEETIDKANKAVFDTNAQCCDIMNHLIKEETIDIPKGYEFTGVDDDNQQVVFERIGYPYPKTYEECCKVISRFAKYDFNKKRELLLNLNKLIKCRDTYWKIAGEEMGLDEPWKPDWIDSNLKYCLKRMGDDIEKASEMTISCILAFPTEEMRDTFYENFKELINETKELL